MMIGDWVSFMSGALLLGLGTLAMLAYRPGRRRGAGAVLGWAIFVGFAAAVGNTFYWQVLGHPLVHSGVMTVAQQRDLGDWLDLLFKGGHALAGWLHLYALWLSLEEHERPRWHVWEMPWYPSRIRCFRRLGRRMSREE